MKVASTKTCKDCGQTKPRDSFYKPSGKGVSPGCRSARCRPCDNKRQLAKLYAKRGYGPRPYRKHTDPDQAYKDYCDRQRLRSWERKGIDPNTREFRDGRWRIKPEFRAHYDSSYQVALSRKPRARFSNAKQNAKLRGLEWTITFEQFSELIKQPCYYWATHTMPVMGSGLDRIDNSKGYLPDNVLPCCKDCNQARGKRYSVPVFKKMIEAAEKAKLEEQESSVQSNQPERSVS